MANAASWLLFLLGIAHIVFGLVRFSGPVADAIAAGFIGQFAEPERRTAFWFLIFGRPLVLVPVLIAVGYRRLPV
ncbi:MAG: DUF6463 family protein [Pseudomonadota bacterium]